MVVLLAAHYFTRVDGMRLFWIAFILKRPLGAVVGSILSKEPPPGGLNLGTAGKSECLLAILIRLVAYQTIHVRPNPLCRWPPPQPPRG